MAWGIWRLGQVGTSAAAAARTTAHAAREVGLAGEPRGAAVRIRHAISPHAGRVAGRCTAAGEVVGTGGGGLRRTASGGAARAGGGLHAAAAHRDRAGHRGGRGTAGGDAAGAGGRERVAAAHRDRAAHRGGGGTAGGRAARAGRRVRVGGHVARGRRTGGRGRRRAALGGGGAGARWRVDVAGAHGRAARHRRRGGAGVGAVAGRRRNLRRAHAHRRATGRRAALLGAGAAGVTGPGVAAGIRRGRWSQWVDGYRRARRAGAPRAGQVAGQAGAGAGAIAADAVYAVGSRRTTVGTPVALLALAENIATFVCGGVTGDPGAVSVLRAASETLRAVEALVVSVSARLRRRDETGPGVAARAAEGLQKQHAQAERPRERAGLGLAAVRAVPVLASCGPRGAVVARALAVRAARAGRGRHAHAGRVGLAGADRGAGAGWL